MLQEPTRRCFSVCVYLYVCASVNFGKGRGNKLVSMMGNTITYQWEHTTGLLSTGPGLCNNTQYNMLILIELN